MQLSLVKVILFHLIVRAPIIHGMTAIPSHNHTFVPDPILHPAGPTQIPKLAWQVDPAIKSHHNGKTSMITNHKMKLIKGQTKMLANNLSISDVTSNQDGSVTIRAVMPAWKPDSAADLPYTVFRLTSRDHSIKHCVPFTAAAAAAAAGAGEEPDHQPDSELRHVSAVVPHLPLSTYCVQLGCSCARLRPCRRRPTRCKRFEHRAGIDMSAWRRATNVTVWRHADTAAGPAVSVGVRQTGYRFESFNLSVLGCKTGQMFHSSLAADGWLRLDTNCSIQYNSSLLMEVFPDTWFCAGGTGGCRDIRVRIGPLHRLPARRPPVLHVSALPGWVTAALVLLSVVTVAVAAAGLLWSRHRHRQFIASLVGTADCRNSPADCAVSAGRPAGLSVLLLHLARSDAERAAVRQLTADLRARGAAVTDSDAPEWRRTARRDATALASAVSAHDRVLLLSSPAAVAAVAAGGGGPGGEPERLLAAAVRQVAGSRRMTDYGRLYQARLAADAPTVAGLVPGAVYTLPEHRQELVAALLITAGAGTDPIDKSTDTFSDSNPNSDTSSGGTNTHSDSVHTAETVTVSEQCSPDKDK